MLVFHRRLWQPQASISIRCCGRICHFPITAIRDRNRPLPQMVRVMEAESAPIKVSELGKEMALALVQETRAILATATTVPAVAAKVVRPATIQTVISNGYSNRPMSTYVRESFPNLNR